VELVLTFEAAQASARAQQIDRDIERAEKTWELEEAFELAATRMRAGITLKQLSKELGRSTKLVEQWENGDREPMPEDFERMAVLYRTTPWQLRYGTPWSRAVSFPNAPESRAHIFAAVLPREARSWLYHFLALLADYGLDDTALERVRESLTSPDYYYDVQYVYEEHEALLFIRAKLRELAEAVWRNLTTPGWVDETEPSGDSIPPLLTDPGFDVAAGAECVRTLHERALHVAYRRVDSLWGHPIQPMNPAKEGSAATTSSAVSSDSVPPYLPDPFSYFNRASPRVRLLLTDTVREPYRAEVRPGVGVVQTRDDDDGAH
jgi:transcriptional regulator with XRE-family HTH domain